MRNHQPIFPRSTPFQIRPGAKSLGDDEPATPTEMGCVPGMDRVGIEAHRRQAGDRLTSDDTKAAEVHVSAQGREREWIDRHRRTQVLRGANS